MKSSGRTHYVRWGHRAFDLAVTVPAVVALAPLLVVVALLVRVRLGAPVLFRQQRPGWHGRPFDILKFRTMTDARGADGHRLPDDERRTRLGEFLRHTSLDELPELLNVLRGEMSLVGPRPLLMKYLGHYSPRQESRHDVRPGITGWAQVNGRNAQSWERKLALDVWYVENRSLALDLYIMGRTLATVIARDGVPSPEYEFDGSTAEEEASAMAEAESLSPDWLRKVRDDRAELPGEGSA